MICSWMNWNMNAVFQSELCLPLRNKIYKKIYIFFFISFEGQKFCLHQWWYELSSASLTRKPMNENQNLYLKENKTIYINFSDAISSFTCELVLFCSTFLKITFLYFLVFGGSRHKMLQEDFNSINFLLFHTIFR